MSGVEGAHFSLKIYVGEVAADDVPDDYPQRACTARIR